MTNVQGQKHYGWSSTGMMVIACLIRGTLAYNNEHDIKPSSFRSKEWNLAHTTVRSYSIGVISDPQRKNPGGGPLKKIAPHLYRFAGFNGNQILFDPEKRYSSWQELAEHVGEMPASAAPGGGNEFVEYKPVALDGSIQLSITKAIEEAPASGISYGELLGHIQAIVAPLRQEIEQLKQGWRPIAPPEPQLSSLERFIGDWIGVASQQQLERVGVSADRPWESNRLAILEALIRDGQISPEEAEQILTGQRLERGDKFVLSFLIREPGSNLPYDPSFWDAPNLAIAVNAIAS